MIGPERDCGLRTLVAVTDLDTEDMRAVLELRFGTFSLTGKQMRSLLTSEGWQWVNTRANGDCWPSTGSYVVVCRNGFYAVVDGVHVTDDRKGAVCGYYRRIPEWQS